MIFGQSIQRCNSVTPTNKRGEDGAIKENFCMLLKLNVYIQIKGLQLEDIKCNPHGKHTQEINRTYTKEIGKEFKHFLKK